MAYVMQISTVTSSYAKVEVETHMWHVLPFD